jgi:ADP-ribose pyrophosphatase
MASEWEVIKNELVFSGKPWFEVYKQVVKLPSGQKVEDFYQIVQPDYVEIVAVNSDHRIQGLWHYKHGVGREHLGLPAGYLEQNEAPLAAAKRELLEECQLTASEWVKLGEFVMEGNRGPAKGHIYMALNCQYSETKLPSDDMEESRLDWLSVQEWLDHLKKGNVAVIGAATAVLLASNELKTRGLA